MSEHLRHSFPASSSSPGRQHQLARPDWPWAARSYSQRSQTQSPYPVQGSSLQGNWETRPTFSATSTQTSAQSTTPQRRSTATPRPVVNTNMAQGESTRQWTFTGFEWAIRDVHKLRDFVEGAETVDLEGGARFPALEQVGDFEVLKESPMLGDHKFKLEIVPIESETSPDNTILATPTRLCIYITSLMLDYTQGDYETHASMMAAIKCQDDRTGERGSRPEWVWEFWQNDWVFRRESEVWECPLPSLSSLLENSRIRETDSIVICVQIHSPVGPSIPQQPSVYYVPRDLLDGLEASLDNSNTGDIRFICLEKYIGTGDSPTIGSSQSASSESSGTTTPFGLHSTARKRVIYAHSDILIRRSEYFATMLSSSFSENPPTSIGERKLYTIVVEEADFGTMYWLLKYCYANWLLFKQNDDPRIAVEGVGAGWSARWLNGKPGEWDWKRFHKTGRSDDGLGDNRSATSGESIPISTSVSRSVSRKSDTYHASTPSQTSSPSSTTRVIPAKASVITSNTPRQGSSNSPRKNMLASRSSHVALDVNSSAATRINEPVSISPSRTFPTSAQFPVSPRDGRKPSLVLSTPDPHPHPTPSPGPASALSIYQVAHRYSMPNLASLAIEHIMSTITAESSFALLLATSSWDELRGIIEDFVVERWDEVSASPEFEQCCKEVAAGEWGPDGGKTLMSVFRRLRSPAML